MVRLNRIQIRPADIKVLGVYIWGFLGFHAPTLFIVISVFRHSKSSSLFSPVDVGFKRNHINCLVLFVQLLFALFFLFLFAAYDHRSKFPHYTIDGLATKEGSWPLGRFQLKFQFSFI